MHFKIHILQHYDKENEMKINSAFIKGMGNVCSK
jgi:hypothetical protein